MTESEDKLIRVLKSLPLFAKNFLVIHDKLGNSSHFVFNRAQHYIHERLETQLRETSKIRALILKGRQQGVSTYVQARFFHRIVTLFPILKNTNTLFLFSLMLSASKILRTSKVNFASLPTKQSFLLLLPFSPAPLPPPFPLFIPGFCLKSTVLLNGTFIYRKLAR